MAGVRWGVRVHADALADRATLAAALSAALREDGVDAGDGGRVRALVLGRDGRSAEFGPGGEWAGWRGAAESAARIYISGVGPAAVVVKGEEGDGATMAA